METTTYQIKGCNADETTCACCGRDDLNKVVWLAPVDADGNEGQAEPYGTTCAARLVAPKAQKAVASTLTNLGKAYAFVAKWADSEYTLDQISNTVAVKFNTWAVVEGNTLKFNTPTGWVEVLAR